MAVPDLTKEGWLPPGRHPASLEDIERVFVEGAPHPERRRLIFAALEVWLGLVLPHVPGALLWIDGGFVTHKLSAPDDVDVVVVPAPRQLTPQVEAALKPYMTSVDQVRRIKTQPMNGLVDGFTIGRGLNLAIWHHQWGVILDENRKPVPGVSKGYLEVTT